jgi:hypothetical protein
VASIAPLALFAPLRWLDGRPLLDTIEPYRRRLFEAAATVDDTARLVYSLVLAGRAKKNWKTCDLVLAALHALLDDSPGGNQCYLLANDEDQAGDDLEARAGDQARRRPADRVGGRLGVENPRRTLTGVAGTLDWAVALLSRAEHGADRELIARVRHRLTGAAAELLVLRAQLPSDRLRIPTYSVTVAPDDAP